MEDATRTEMIKHLEELRLLLAARSTATDAAESAALVAHIDELRTLVQNDSPDAGTTKTSARGLEQRLLALEAEHPQLSAFASRIAHALESAGL